MRFTSGEGGLRNKCILEGDHMGIIVDIKAYHGDSSACLVVDGKLKVRQ